LRIKLRSLNGSERCTSRVARLTGPGGMVDGSTLAFWLKVCESAAAQVAGSFASVVPPGNSSPKLISAPLKRLVNESSPCARRRCA